MADRALERPAGVLTRRQFLYIAGGTVTVAATGGLLAACGGTAAPSASAPGASGAADACPTVTPSTAKVGGAFNLFTWAGYDGKGVPAMDAWYTDNGLNLNVKYISNEVLETYLKSPAGKDWDASSNNQGDCEYGYASGIQSPISVAEVPALGTMYDAFRNGSFWKVCDGVYNSVPWTWGPIAINTRKDRVAAGALKSWDELFDSKYTGRIGTYDDALNMVSTAACATSNDPGKLTRDQLNGAVKDWLKKLKPQLRVLSTSIGDQQNLLDSGDVDIELVGLLWFVGASTSKQIDFRVPDEGTYGFVDAIIIPPWAKNRQNAVAFANALTTGDAAVAVLESVNQLSSNPEVNDKVKPEVRKLYPDDVVTYLEKTLKWNKFWYDPNGDYATVEEWRKVWDDVKAGV